MFHRGKCEKDFNEQGPKGQNTIFRRPEGHMEGQQGQWQGLRPRRGPEGPKQGPEGQSRRPKRPRRSPRGSSGVRASKQVQR